MSLWLNGWTGDNAAKKVVGRACNRLLLSYTQVTWGLPGSLFTSSWQYLKDEHSPVRQFEYARVHCLTPGARPGFACNIETMPLGGNAVENFLAVDVAELDDGTGKAPWQPGVHLFLIAMSLSPLPNSSGTLATAIVDRHVPRVDQTWQYGLSGTPAIGAVFANATPAVQTAPTRRRATRQKTRAV